MLNDPVLNPTQLAILMAIGTVVVVALSVFGFMLLKKMTRRKPPDDEG